MPKTDSQLDIDKPRKKKTLPKYLDVSEAKLLFAAPYKTQPADRLILGFGMKLGLRSEEICSVKINHIKISDMQVFVEQGKYSKDRIVPIPYDLLEEVKDYIKIFGLEGDNLLFEGWNQRKILRMVKGYATKVGIKQKITTHMLRHTYAVHSLQAGQSIRTVQKNLGHSSLTTTQIYLEIVSADIKRDVLEHPLPY